MKKIFVILTIFFFCKVLYAADRVPGTKVVLEPPEGFVEAVQFPGFLMESTGSSIMVTEIPGPFGEVSKGFTKEGLATRGMTLKEKQEVKVKSGNGLLMHLSQSARGENFLKWMLGFGNEKETVLVVATFPEQFEKDLSVRLKNALLSVVWDLDVKVDFFEGLTFRIKEYGDLKIVKKIGNNILLTRNGQFPIESAGDPMVFMGSSISQGWSIPGDKKEFARNRFEKTEIVVKPKVTAEKKAEVDGLSGYMIEAVGNHKETDQKLFVMQCMLFSPDGYYIFQGIVNFMEKEKYNSIFASIVKSFTRI